MNMNSSELIDAARKMHADPKHGPAMMKGWRAVCDEIEKRALAKRPKMKSFEVHHCTEVARHAYLTACVNGRELPVCVEMALGATGLF